MLSAPALANDVDRANASWATLYASGQVSQPVAGSAAAPAADAAPAVASEMTSIRRRITEVAARHGVPAGLALAVARIESNMRCQARGRAGELGPLQIKPATARGLGYSGPASALNSCGAGLEWGMRHLAVAYKRCGSVAGAAALHNRGLASACSRTSYSHRVTRLMASL
ncbi:MAG: transglycosylase SLT domain-containing protein [Phreatobacter sp.]|uniref:transglycosylase SLT domain-containing protein n=1 Tax=Phreatobacter sp. TaxID=1966341 RepID=UPI0040367B25